MRSTFSVHSLHEACALTLVVAQDLSGVLIDEWARPLSEVFAHKFRVMHLHGSSGIKGIQYMLR
jgi:hypothetical protein